MRAHWRGAQRMSLGHYYRAWRDIAHELTDLLTAGERRDILLFLKDHPLIDAWSLDGLVNRSDFEAVAKLLEHGPKKLHAVWKVTPRQDRPRLWLRLQFLVLRSAKAADVAEVTEAVVGMPYRKALRLVSERLLQFQLEPSSDDVLDLLDRYDG